MSKAATCGMPGIASIVALMPARLGGLCRGARSENFSTVFITPASILTEPLYSSPPWTTRWPTAEISEALFITPVFLSVSADRMSSIPFRWSGTFCSIFCSPLPAECFRRDFSSPIFSSTPFARSFRSGISNNLYLIDELPQLMTKIFKLAAPCVKFVMSHV